MIIGAVIAVIAVLGFGFYQWHETPEFCTAICHTPMNDVYRQTLYANPYEAFILMCLLTEMPLLTYYDVWEKSYGGAEP